MFVGLFVEVLRLFEDLAALSDSLDEALVENELDLDARDRRDAALALPLIVRERRQQERLPFATRKQVIIHKMIDKIKSRHGDASWPLITISGAAIGPCLAW